MTTQRRDRYRAALADLDQARAQMRRADLMAQIALNRVRQAEEEGFDEEATRREARRADLEQAHVAEVQAVKALATSVETLRQAAVVEEIDEVATEYDARLAELVDLLGRALETHAALERLATHSHTLVRSLPEADDQAHRLAMAEVTHVRSIRRQIDALIDATISQPRSAATSEQA
jgi:transposase